MFARKLSRETFKQFLRNQKNPPLELVTADRLYRLDNELPNCPEEYNLLVSAITGGTGVFPGDSAPVFDDHYVSKSASPHPKTLMLPKHFMVEAGKNSLAVERFSPAIDCPEVMNRIIFDFDLICQTAIFNTLGSRGSYDKERVYVRRFFNADIVFVIRDGTLPVGVLTMTYHVIKLNLDAFELTEMAEKHLAIRDNVVEIPYFWVHGGLFATVGQGIANTIVFQFFTEQFLQCRDQYKPVFDNETNQIDVQKGLVYILGHSDKVPPFHIFRAYFKPIRTGIVRDAIFREAFEFITPEETRSTAFFDLVKGVDTSAADPLNSYKQDNLGNVIIPDGEKSLSSYGEFKTILGDGLGSKAIYFLGVFDETVLHNFQQRLKKRGVRPEKCSAVRQSSVFFNPSRRRYSSAAEAAEEITLRSKL